MHWPLPCMIRIQNSLASSLYDTYPEFISLFPAWYVSRIHWPLPCMIRIQNSLASSLHDAYPEFTYLIPEFPHHTCPEFTVRIWPLVEQELLTLPEHLSSPPVFNGVRVTRSLGLCVYFVDRCLSFCTFSFGHCVVCSSSICRFWLPLWYLQTLLRISVSYLSRIHLPHSLIYVSYLSRIHSPHPLKLCIIPIQNSLATSPNPCS